MRELHRLRQLEEENSKLKEIVAVLTLDKQMLKDALKKSFKSGAVKTFGNGFKKRLQGIRAQGLRCCNGCQVDYYYAARKRGRQAGQKTY